MTLGCQIATGILVMLHYVAASDSTFWVIDYLIRSGPLHTHPFTTANRTYIRRTQNHSAYSSLLTHMYWPLSTRTSLTGQSLPHPHPSAPISYLYRYALMSIGVMLLYCSWNSSHLLYDMNNITLHTISQYTFPLDSHYGFGCFVCKAD